MKTSFPKAEQKVIKQRLQNINWTQTFLLFVLDWIEFVDMQMEAGQVVIESFPMIMYPCKHQL